MERQLHIGFAVELAPEVMPVKNGWSLPNSGGFWTSTFRDGKSEWVDAAADMGLGPYNVHWHLLEPARGARILTIHSHQDLETLLREFGAVAMCEGGSLWWPNWEGIADDYDAVRLTSLGQKRTRLTRPTLSPWDSESTLWFRWRFKSWKRIETPDPPRGQEPRSAPRAGLGWEILNRMAANVPERTRGEFIAEGRFFEGAFTSGYISESMYRTYLVSLSEGLSF